MAIKQYFNFMKIILLFLLFVTFSSCSKHNNKEFPIYYNDQEFKDYTIFPATSYWIYVDSASRAIDSMYLMTQKVSIYDGVYHNDYPYERFENYYFSSYNNDTIYETSNMLINKPGPSISVLWQRKAIALTNLYFSNCIVGDILTWNHNLKYAAYKDSLTLSNGKSYKSVKQFTTIQPDGGEVLNGYYSKRVGMIRKELYNGQVWNLQRYYIAKWGLLKKV